ncbi:MAG: hypothetical protein Pg6A_18740 [Termitinemataceae bacterium]|nr:MAG: hypothetical protein Pg6A_18740 [Termitinemataceae bacterium]
MARIFRPVCICILLLHAAALGAQELELIVLDSDLDIPVDGAQVKSWDGKEYICDDEGRVLLPLPEDRAVVLRISYPGYISRNITVQTGESRRTVKLRLEHDLLVTGFREGGTRPGQGVGMDKDAIARTAESGIIEDVMSAVKLLPGVGYSGSFNAPPSVRGGAPGDMTAVLDGFYIDQPFHWAGIVSIFDPNMVENLRLSHGVFSARYGHTISALLEVSSRRPSQDSIEIEAGLSTSAVNLNLFFPIGNKGGISAMGKVTYWDPFVEFFKQYVEDLSYVDTAPYIRSGAFSGYYRFSSDLELSLNSYVGFDGMGVLDERNDIPGRRDYLRFNWKNMLAFLSAGVDYNPAGNMLLKADIGAGCSQTDIIGLMLYDWAPDDQKLLMLNGNVNLQGSVDFDWELGEGFTTAFGLRELYANWTREEVYHALIYRTEAEAREMGYTGATWPWSNPQRFLVDMSLNNHNNAFNTSTYALLEYRRPRFGAELGLRLDHLALINRNASTVSAPLALSPRLNMDFELLKDRGMLYTLSLVLGTGLFSSIDKSLAFMDERNAEAPRFNRSWTSIAALKAELPFEFSLTVESYFKLVYDRAYMQAHIDFKSEPEPSPAHPVFWFDGEGRVWGIDVMLQRAQSKYVDGWVSYTYTNALYRDPHGGGGAPWYYPSYHRFHNLSLFMDIKPFNFLNIALRTGLASGAPERVSGGSGITPIFLDGQNSYFELYERIPYDSAVNRGKLTFPLDIKLSFYFFDSKQRCRGEIYLSIENLLTEINKTEDERYGRNLTISTYELPIPMGSFGIKWRF